MARNTDFIGFTFNGRHSSEFNIYSVSDGSRYQDTLVPNPVDYTEQIPGGVGQYYFGSDEDIKEFPLEIAFDKLTEEQLRELRLWLSPQAVGELIFDERPYKTYTAKISSSPSISFLCFDEYNKQTQKKYRVYKGEGSINFVCYYPLGVVSGEKKELNWYRDQIDDKIYRSIGGNSSALSYELKDKEIAVLEKIKGKTTETGEGEKSPDNPYTLSGAKPTVLTVCGRNLWQGNRSYTVDQAQFYTTYSDAQTVKWVNALPRGVPITFSANWDYDTGTQVIWFGMTTAPNQLKVENHTAVTIPEGVMYDGIRVYAGGDKTQDAVVSEIQFESGAATPYKPYDGQAITLPEELELYGVGERCDEYDCLSGSLTRCIAVRVFTGNEAWTKYNPGTSETSTSCFTYTLTDKAIGWGTSICSHFRNTRNTFPFSPSRMTHGIYCDHNEVRNIYVDWGEGPDVTVEAFKTWLAEQNAAGTPMTVVYQLAAPVVTKIEEVSPFPLVSPMNDSNLIMNINPEYFNYFTDSAADISLRIYGAKYANVDEWSISSGMLNDLNTTGVNVGYDHYITLPDGSKGIQLYNPGDKETDFILSFNKPKPMNDIKFTLSDGQQFILNLRSDDTDVEKYGAVSDEEKQVAQMTGGVITIDTKKNRIMYKYGAGTAEAFETSIYFALKEGQFFKIPRNKTAQGGYNLVISADSYFDGNSIDIDYDYLYY